MSLAGRTVLVTGGSRGIGRACVLEAVAQGARVAFCSRGDGAESRRVEAEAAELGGRGAATGLRADVADAASVAHLFEGIRTRYGPVDGVISNAATSRENLLVSSSTEEWDEVVEVNLTGGFLVAREAVRDFLQRGRGGSLVAIGTLSQYGVSGNPAYGTSKGGLLGLVRLLAAQYGHRGVVANLLVPGYVQTVLSSGMSEANRRKLIDGCPLRRSGSPEEIASVAIFLLAEGGSGFNGRVVHAAGGLREVPP